MQPTLPFSKALRLTAHWRLILFLLPAAFLIAFFFYPLANILRLSLSQDAFLAILTQAYYWETLWFTFWQATLSTLLTLLVGLPAAYLFARYDFPGKSLLRAVTTVPFMLPTVVVAAAFRALLGSGGPLNQGLVALFDLEQAPLQLEQTLTIILLAHVFYNVAVVVRLVGGFWANLNPALVAAAEVLGASPLRAFLEITLPLLRPALIAASLLIYLFTFTSFGVILILGGPAYSTLETEIYRQYVTFLQPDIAAVLSLLQIIFTFILMSLYSRWQQRASVALDFRPQQSTLRPPDEARERLLVALLIAGLLLFLVSPMLALIWESFSSRDGGFTLAYYRALPELERGSITFVPPLTAIRNSLGYALLTMLVAGLLGLLSASLLSQPTRVPRNGATLPSTRKAATMGDNPLPLFSLRSWLDPLFMLPLGASAVTLGFGYVVTYDWLRTSPLLVLIAHSLVAFPFVVRVLLPVLSGIRPRLREAAAVMGASPWRVWREIDLPIIGRALLVAAVFAFTISMGEFGATSFIMRPNSGYLTMPIAINRYLGQPGALNFGQAMAMSAILMVVTAAGFIAIERFRYADIGEF